MSCAPLTAHCWAREPLQSQSWTTVPFATPPPLTSRHLPSARMVPSPGRLHFCAALPLQPVIWMGVPLAVFAQGTSTHLPPMPRISEPPPLGGVSLETRTQSITSCCGNVVLPSG